MMAAFMWLRVGLGGADIARVPERESSCSASRVLPWMMARGSAVGTVGRG